MGDRECRALQAKKSPLAPLRYIPTFAVRFTVIKAVHWRGESHPPSKTKQR